MASFALFLIISLVFSGPVQSSPSRRSKSECYLPIVTRHEWGGRLPASVTNMVTPVPYVVIHHTAEPDVCYTLGECKAAMRSMQDYHQLEKGWADIGYNFVVGGEGTVFVGRGWEAVGAHAIGMNTQSIGISLIGDFTSKRPSTKQMDAARHLIDMGISLGYISLDYQLIGHRQVSATECPGQVLFDEISTWENFNSNYGSD